MKQIFKHSILLISLTIFLFACDNAKHIDTSKLVANYQRDKFVPADTTKEFENAITNSGGWTISLKEKNQFAFRGTDKIVNGTWSVNKKDGEDYFIKFVFQNDTINAKLNGNIIYFDKQHKLFDNLFEYVIFVKTTRKLESSF